MPISTETGRIHDGDQRTELVLDTYGVEAEAASGFVDVAGGNELATLGRVDETDGVACGNAVWGRDGRTL